MLWAFKAAKIQEQNCDYVFALKRNQADLYEEALTLFILEKFNRFKNVPHTPSPPLEKSHGESKKEPASLQVICIGKRL